MFLASLNEPPRHQDTKDAKGFWVAWNTKTTKGAKRREGSNRKAGKIGKIQSFPIFPAFLFSSSAESSSRLFALLAASAYANSPDEIDRGLRG